MSGEQVNEASLVNGGSGPVNISNSSITIVAGGNSREDDSKAAEDTQEGNNDITKILQSLGLDEKDITWLQHKKFFYLHEKPINANGNVFYGKQVLPDRCRDVAVKLVKYSDQAKKEVDMLTDAHHPNVIEIIDAGKTTSSPRHIYIVMELCAKNLRQYVEDLGGKPLTMETFVSIFNELLNGLGHLHDKQILHRDIKPDNILITESEAIKLSDFGIGKQIQSGRAAVTQTKFGAGSEGYRSPESYVENAKLTTTADIFSLALVAIHLISNGLHPFGTNPHDWSYNIRNNKNLDLSIIPHHIPPSKRAQLTDLVSAMLKSDPIERPSVDKIKSHDFFRDDLKAAENTQEGIPDLTKILQSLEVDEKDVTWLQQGRLFLFHERPINNSSTVFYGKQILPDCCRDVAVKLIKYSDQAKREVNLSMTARHPNVVQIYDAGEVQFMGRRVYIVMELCTRNLCQYVEDLGGESLAMETFVSIFNQLLKGLKHLHDNKILHRDIKPGNILITESGEMKFSDFGISKQIESDRAEVTQTKYGAGSEGYRPPESYIENAKLTTAADIFSLALVIIHLISKGRHPFGSKPHDWGYNIRNNRSLDLSVIPQHIPPSKRAQLINLVSAMLKSESQQRPSTEGIKSHCFFTETGSSLNNTSSQVQSDTGRKTLCNNEPLESQKCSEEGDTAGSAEKSKRNFKFPFKISIRRGKGWKDKNEDAKEDWNRIDEKKDVEDETPRKNTQPLHRPYLLDERDCKNHYCDDAEEVATIKSAEIKMSSSERDKAFEHGVYGKFHFGLWNSKKVIVVEQNTQYTAKQYRERLENYRRCLELFNHPNVARLIAVTTDTPVRLVMKSMELGSLKEYLQQLEPAALSPADYLGFIYQVVQGMSHIASKGYVHRQLRSQNVFIGINGICKIACFWSACAYALRHTSPDIKYPVRWTAPELVFDGNLSLKSDVWSFGVLALEVYTHGAEPYEGLSNLDVEKLVLKGDYMTRPDLCPEHVYDKLLECWDKDPKKRPKFTELEVHFHTCLGKITKEMQTAHRKIRVATIEADEISISSLKTHNAIKHGAFGSFSLGQWSSRTVIVVNGSKQHHEKLKNYKKCLQYLHHPNIVRLLAVTSENPIRLVIQAMDCCLEEYLHRHGPYELHGRDYLRIIYQIACGMNHVASLGYGHGDLRPENIFVGFNDVCKIAGFWDSRSSESDIWNFGVLMLDVFSNAQLGSSAYEMTDEYRLERPVHCPQSIFMIHADCRSFIPLERPEFAELESYFYQYLARPVSCLFGNVNPKDFKVSDVKDAIREVQDKLSAKKGFGECFSLLKDLQNLQDSDDFDTLLQLAECELMLGSGEVPKATRRARDCFKNFNEVDLSDISERIIELSEMSSPLRSLIFVNVLCGASANPVISSINTVEWIASLIDAFYILAKRCIFRLSKDIIIKFYLVKIEELLCKLRTMTDVASGDRAIEEVNCIIAIGYGHIYTDEQEKALSVFSEGVEILENEFGCTKAGQHLANTMHRDEYGQYQQDILHDYENIFLQNEQAHGNLQYQHLMLEACHQELEELQKTLKDQEVRAISSSSQFGRDTDHGFYGNFRFGHWNSRKVIIIESKKEYQEQFQNYRRCLQSFDHPNIVRLLATTKQEPACLVIEWMKCGTLNDYLHQLKPGEFATKDCFKFLEQIADGMSYITSKNHIHRDLRSHNVLFGNDRVCKIAGFWTTACQDSSHFAKFPIPWTAPESLGGANWSLKSDAWSFGVLVIELFKKGRHPYGEMSIQEVKARVSNGYRIPKPDLCPIDVYSKVLECWNKDSNKRPEFAELRDYFQEHLRLLQRPLPLPPANYETNTSKEEKDGYEQVDSEDSSEEYSVPLLPLRPLPLPNNESNEMSDEERHIYEVYAQEASENFPRPLPQAIKNNPYKVQTIEACAIDFTLGNMDHGFYGNFRFGRWNSRAVIVVESKKEYQEQLRNYRKCLELFDQPNIVQLLALTNEEPISLVLESMEHGCLKDYLRQLRTETLDFNDYLEFVRQIASGMCYVASMRYIHRDLRTQNILVGKNASCKISGFWSACTETSHDSSHCSKFQLRWTAPESLDNRDWSLKSDIWSFGVLVIEIFTNGAFPYAAMSNERVRDGLSKGYRMPMPDRCRLDIYSKVLECWNKHPQSRPEFSDLNNYFYNYLKRPANDLLSSTGKAPDSG